MGKQLVHNDLDKRIYAPFEATNANYRRAMSDADVVDEMAAMWVSSGGDAGGFDEHAGAIRQRIKEMES
jgi:hypothetical protein